MSAEASRLEGPPVAAAVATVKTEKKRVKIEVTRAVFIALIFGGVCIG